MSLRLDPSLPKNKSVPKEYNMHLTNKDSYNTFIFSEKDMPGYSKRFHAEGAPSHWLNRKKIEKKKANISFRKAVPSTLFGSSLPGDFTDSFEQSKPP